jgi:hypothetical protein
LPSRSSKPADRVGRLAYYVRDHHIHFLEAVSSALDGFSQSGNLFIVVCGSYSHTLPEKTALGLTIA